MRKITSLALVLLLLSVQLVTAQVISKTGNTITVTPKGGTPQTFTLGNWYLNQPTQVFRSTPASTYVGAESPPYSVLVKNGAGYTIVNYDKAGNSIGGSTVTSDGTLISLQQNQLVLPDNWANYPAAGLTDAALPQPTTPPPSTSPAATPPPTNPAPGGTSAPGGSAAATPSSTSSGTPSTGSAAANHPNIQFEDHPYVYDSVRGIYVYKNENNYEFALYQKPDGTTGSYTYTIYDPNKPDTNGVAAGFLSSARTFANAAVPAPAPTPPASGGTSPPATTPARPTGTLSASDISAMNTALAANQVVAIDSQGAVYSRDPSQVTVGPGGVVTDKSTGKVIGNQLSKSDAARIQQFNGVIADADIRLPPPTPPPSGTITVSSNDLVGMQTYLNAHQVVAIDGQGNIYSRKPEDVNIGTDGSVTDKTTGVLLGRQVTQNDANVITQANGRVQFTEGKIAPAPPAQPSANPTTSPPSPSTTPTTSQIPAPTITGIPKTASDFKLDIQSTPISGGVKLSDDDKAKLGTASATSQPYLKADGTVELVSTTPSPAPVLFTTSTVPPSALAGVSGTYTQTGNTIKSQDGTTYTLTNGQWKSAGGDYVLVMDNGKLASAPLKNGQPDLTHEYNFATQTDVRSLGGSAPTPSAGATLISPDVAKALAGAPGKVEIAPDGKSGQAVNDGTWSSGTFSLTETRTPSILTVTHNDDGTTTTYSKQIQESCGPLCDKKTGRTNANVDSVQESSTVTKTIALDKDGHEIHLDPITGKPPAGAEVASTKTVTEASTKPIYYVDPLCITACRPDPIGVQQTTTRNPNAPGTPGYDPTERVTDSLTLTGPKGDDGGKMVTNPDTGVVTYYPKGTTPNPAGTGGEQVQGGAWGWSDDTDRLAAMGYDTSVSRQRIRQLQDDSIMDSTAGIGTKLGTLGPWGIAGRIMKSYDEYKGIETLTNLVWSSNADDSAKRKQNLINHFCLAAGIDNCLVSEICGQIHKITADNVVAGRGPNGQYVSSAVLNAERSLPIEVEGLTAQHVIDMVGKNTTNINGVPVDLQNPTLNLSRFGKIKLRHYHVQLTVTNNVDGGRDLRYNVVFEKSGLANNIETPAMDGELGIPNQTELTTAQINEQAAAAPSSLEDINTTQYFETIAANLPPAYGAPVKAVRWYPQDQVLKQSQSVPQEQKNLDKFSFAEWDTVCLTFSPALPSGSAGSSGFTNKLCVPFTEYAGGPTHSNEPSSQQNQGGANGPGGANV